ncbi:MAG: hypothetical protein OCD76_09030 [Reichenbachiella sp.]
MKYTLSRLRMHILVSSLILIGLSACFDAATTEAEIDPDQNEIDLGQITLTLSMEADFGAALVQKAVAAVCIGTEDHPGVTAGLDCDSDGGVVTFSTPSQFRGAFGDVYVYNTTDTLSLLPKLGILTDAEIVNLNQTIVVAEILADRKPYTDIYVEVYYLDMKIPLNASGEEQWIRIYMSDDDFAHHMTTGHHQGDIILLDSLGNEQGWVAGCAPWTLANVSTTRSTDHEGAGGIDSQTGHGRGFFGDEALWNQNTFMQGSTQDVYFTRAPISLNLTTGTEANITISFPIENTWYFEDFDANGVFSPGGNDIEMCTEGSTWAPLIPIPVFIASTI